LQRSGSPENWLAGSLWKNWMENTGEEEKKHREQGTLTKSLFPRQVHLAF
jgi:hypothetical protein